MQFPSSEKQLVILKETIVKVARSSDQEERVLHVFDAFKALGFNRECRYRVAVINKDRTRLEIRYALGMDGLTQSNKVSYTVSNSLHAEVLGSNQSQIFNLTETRLVSKGFGMSTRIQSFLSIPLFNKGITIGVLSIDSPSKNSFNHEDLVVLEPLAALLGTVIISNSDEGQRDEDVISVISRFRKLQVLVLGKDNGPELGRLHSICSVLATLGYKPVLVKDHPDIPELSNEEKVRVFADHSRFVIIENSFPAGQIAEIKMCSTNRIVTAAVRERGLGSSYMVTDYFKDYEFMEEFEYLNVEALSETLKEAVSWAELQIQTRADYYNNLYPWRK
jgi:hypothetical protein